MEFENVVQIGYSYLKSSERVGERNKMSIF